MNCRLSFLGTRGGGVGTSESGAPSGQTVKVGDFHKRMPGTAQGIAAVFVAKQEQHIEIGHASILKDWRGLTGLEARRLFKAYDLTGKSARNSLI